MNKPKYSTSITMNQKDYNQLQALKSKGIKVVDVFRKGLYQFNLSESTKPYTPPDYLK